MMKLYTKVFFRAVFNTDFGERVRVVGDSPLLGTLDGRMDGWMDGWMDVSVCVCVSSAVCVSVLCGRFVGPQEGPRAQDQRRAVSTTEPVSLSICFVESVQSTDACLSVRFPSWFSLEPILLPIKEKVQYKYVIVDETGKLINWEEIEDNRELVPTGEMSDRGRQRARQATGSEGCKQRSVCWLAGL